MPGEKKIIVFINHWARDLGGAEHSLIDIMNLAAKQSCAYLITAEPGPLVEKAQALGVRCQIIPCSLQRGALKREHLFLSMLVSWAALCSFLLFVVRVFVALRQIQPDVVHANVPKSHVTLFLCAILGYSGRCWFHVREIFKPGSTPFRIYQLLFPQKTGRCIAISQSVQAALPLALKHKSRVIYNGVAIPPQANISVDCSELRFVYLGRVVPWKGCHLLIEMFAKTKKLYPGANLHLTLIGNTLYWSQEYRNQLMEQIKRLSVASCCFLLPHTATPLKDLAHYHVFCNASCNEPFGRSIAEAQALGLPVVSYDSGAVREIVVHEQTGFLAPFGDESAFVKMLGKFIADPALITSMGKKGRERAFRLFNRDIQMPIIVEELLKN